MHPYFLPEREKQAVADHWKPIAHATEPLDRAGAEHTLETIFMGTRTEMPSDVIWVSSPAEAARVEKQVAPSVPWPSGLEWREPDWAQSVDRGMMTPCHWGFAEQLIDPKNDHFDWNLERSWERVWQPVLGSWPAILAGSSPPSILGPSFAGRAAYADLMKLSGGPMNARSALAAIITRNLHMVWIYDDIVVLCERPVALRRTNADELHHDQSPAIEYADGSGFYGWRGDVVPPWVITNPTAARALGIEDSARRRAAVDRVGWVAVVRELGLLAIDVHDDPGNAEHTLHLFELPHQLAVEQFGRPANVLVMTNGSPDRAGVTHTFAEVVPDHCTTTISAAAWQYGVTPEKYAHLARRT